MKTILRSVIWIAVFGLLSCEQEEPVKLHLDFIDPDAYYSDEIIPEEYKMIYGKWKLYGVSGGFSGGGHIPDYDYLEIRKRGIYGLIRSDSLFEYGKIELDNWNDNNTDLLQVKLIPEFYRPGNPKFNPPERLIDLQGKDSLHLHAPCCDMYNYHFKRVK